MAKTLNKEKMKVNVLKPVVTRLRQDVSDYVDDGLSKHLKVLSELKSQQQDREPEKVWRPSGNPSDDIRVYKYEVNHK